MNKTVRYNDANFSRYTQILVLILCCFCFCLPAAADSGYTLIFLQENADDSHFTEMSADMQTKTAAPGTSLADIQPLTDDLAVKYDGFHLLGSGAEITGYLPGADTAFPAGIYSEKNDPAFAYGYYDQNREIVVECLGYISSGKIVTGKITDGRLNAYDAPLVREDGSSVILTFYARDRYALFLRSRNAADPWNPVTDTGEAAYPQLPADPFIVKDGANFSMRFTEDRHIGEMIRYFSANQPYSADDLQWTWWARWKGTDENGDPLIELDLGNQYLGSRPRSKPVDPKHLGAYEFMSGYVYGLRDGDKSILELWKHKVKVYGVNYTYYEDGQYAEDFDENGMLNPQIKEEVVRGYYNDNSYTKDIWLNREENGYIVTEVEVTDDGTGETRIIEPVENYERKTVIYTNPKNPVEQLVRYEIDRDISTSYTSFSIKKIWVGEDIDITDKKDEFINNLVLKYTDDGSTGYYDYGKFDDTDGDGVYHGTKDTRLTAEIKEGSSTGEWEVEINKLPKWIVNNGQKVFTKSSWSAVETPMPGYSVSVNNSENEITNTIIPKLSIKKDTNGTGDGTFTFHIQFDKDVNQKFVQDFPFTPVAGNNNEYTFTLTNPKLISIDDYFDLPYGVKCTIWEESQTDWTLTAVKKDNEDINPMPEKAEATLNKPETGFVFTNKYTAPLTLTVAKNVSGQLASRDKYFKFTININTGESGRVLTLSGADTDPYYLAVTDAAYTAAVMKADNIRDDNTAADGQQIICDAEGKAEITVYMRHGQSVKISGILSDSSYTVTEGSDSAYDVSVTVTGDGKTADGTVDEENIALVNPVSDSKLKSDTTVTFTNTSDVSAPTGININNTSAVWMLVLAALSVGTVFLFRSYYSRSTRGRPFCCRAADKSGLHPVMRPSKTGEPVNSNVSQAEKLKNLEKFL